MKHNIYINQIIPGLRVCCLHYTCSCAMSGWLEVVFLFSSSWLGIPLALNPVKTNTVVNIAWFGNRWQQVPIETMEAHVKGLNWNLLVILGPVSICLSTCVLTHFSINCLIQHCTWPTSMPLSCAVRNSLKQLDLGQSNTCQLLGTLTLSL